MTNVRRLLLFIVTVAWGSGLVSHAAYGFDTIETNAREAIVVDFQTGAVLLEKNADVRMPPASMSKLMTIAMAFEALKNGSLALDDTVAVSEKAWRKGGSKMFVEVGKRVVVSDLLRGIIVQSGNDASIVLAEALAGTEEAFARRLNERAREIGLTDSTFTNATGWPDPNHRMTVRDLARLAAHIVAEYPDYHPIFSETEFTFSGISQNNRNPLLYRNMGADGLKTGHTQEAGYGLTATAQRGDRRLIVVVTGLPSARARGDEAERLFDWGFRTFENYALLRGGEIVEEVPVWHGVDTAVPVVLEEDLVLTLPRAARADMTVSVAYASPIRAPIQAGAPIATLRVTSADENVAIEKPLFAARDVGPLGFIGRVQAVLHYLAFGVLEPSDGT